MPTVKEIKKAIYKYMKAVNKIQARQFNWNKQTLKLQNDLTFDFINTFTTNNINNILNMATAKKIIKFI